MSTRYIKIYFMLSITFLLISCSPVLSPSQYPNPATSTAFLTYTPLPEEILLMLTPRATFTPPPSPYPTIDYTNASPDFFFTPATDPNTDNIQVEIEPEHSQEEIAKILFSKWLDHFMGENISKFDRLEGYSITSIEVPRDQKCAKVYGGDFVVNAFFNLQTTLPMLTTGEGHTNWVAGGGNILGSNKISKSTAGVIFQNGNIYTLKVVWQVPTC